MNTRAIHPEEVRAIRSDRERVSDLLARYPRVTHEESREILDFVQTGRHLDIGLLTSNERLRPNLDAFMDDHKAHFRVNLGEVAALVAGILAVLVVLSLIWAAFA